jgi:quercetin dioxygenase-like cupin family protein
VAVSAAQPAPPGQLLTQPLADLPGREVRINLLDREPGASSARRRHPGHHTFGYDRGTYEFAINGEPARTLKAGDTFYEPPTAVHSTSRNPSTDKRAKILVFMAQLLVDGAFNAHAYPANVQSEPMMVAMASSLDRLVAAIVRRHQGAPYPVSRQGAS